MVLIELSPEEHKALMMLMNRVQLQGSEAYMYIQIMQKIIHPKDPKNVTMKEGVK